MRLFAPLALLIFASPALAGEITGSAGAQLFSSYYFRGSDVFAGRPNVQPSVTLAWATPGLSLNVWAAVPLARRAELKSVRDEVDVTLNWDLPIGEIVTFSLGSILYMNPAAEPFFHTEEVYLLARAPIGGGFAVRGGAYADLNAFKGVYATLGPGYVMEPIGPLKLEAWLLAGMTKYADKPAALVELGATVNASYDVGQGIAALVSMVGSWNAFEEEMRYAMSAGGAFNW